MELTFRDFSVALTVIATEMYKGKTYTESQGVESLILSLLPRMTVMSPIKDSALNEARMHSPKPNLRSQTPKQHFIPVEITVDGTKLFKQYTKQLKNVFLQFSVPTNGIGNGIPNRGMPLKEFTLFCQKFNLLSLITKKKLAAVSFAVFVDLPLDTLDTVHSAAK